jgi:hypothetical protein
VVGLLAARKATAEVVPEKAAYLLGETVHATVWISGRKDFKVSDVRAGLLTTSRYSYLTPNSRGGSLLVDETDREVVVDTECLPTGGTIRKGKTAEHQISFRLPTDAPPWGREITGVAWAIGVFLTAPGGPDVSVNAPHNGPLHTRHLRGAIRPRAGTPLSSKRRDEDPAHQPRAPLRRADRRKTGGHPPARRSRPER